jgi:hypothetical protein
MDNGFFVEYRGTVISGDFSHRFIALRWDEITEQVMIMDNLVWLIEYLLFICRRALYTSLGQLTKGRLQKGVASLIPLAPSSRPLICFASSLLQYKPRSIRCIQNKQQYNKQFNKPRSIKLHSITLHYVSHNVKKAGRSFLPESSPSLA